MIPLLLTRSQINSQSWDDFIERSQQQSIYGLSWYLDIVCDDWNALVWPSVDYFEVVMPLPVKTKYKLTAIQQPLFCQYLGIFSQSDLTGHQANAFLKALSSFSYISSYCFHPLNYKVIANILAVNKQFKFELYHTFWLSLSDPYETTRKRYSKDRKSNLKRSEKNDLLLEKSDDPKVMTDLFKENHQRKIEGGVHPNAYRILHKLVEVLIGKQSAELWYASIDGEKCAAALFAGKGNKAVYLFNAANETGRKSNARTHILDRFFKNYSGVYTYFDFESPEIKSIASFYKGFGSEKMPFISIRKNELPFPLKQIQEWRKKQLFKTRQDLSEGPYKI